MSELVAGAAPRISQLEAGALQLDHEVVGIQRRELRDARHALAPKIDVVPWVQVDAGGLTAVGMF